MFALHTPFNWLNHAYQHAAEDNVLAALNPNVFFGYFSVCADGQGFGYANTYPSLDGHQLCHALLFLGRLEEVLANWRFVQRWQRQDGLLPIRIDARGEGLYTHWVPGNPLRALGAITHAHNAYAIYTHTLDKNWLSHNLASINLSARYLASLVTPEGRVGGAGYYVEMPTRIEWDGISQAYAVEALEKIAALNAGMDERRESARWTELAGRIRANFWREFWRDDHCVEYIHPQRGPVYWHGLTDVDWAALAMDLLPASESQRLWLRLKNETGFRYGGMPTGISTAPESYEDWEFIPAEQFPNHNRRHDLAAMGRVWYVEAWARSRWGDTEGLVDSLKVVAEVGACNNYFWHERYYPSCDALRPGGPLTYCEYPANLVRIVNQFLLGVELMIDGSVRIAPQLPAAWWTEGFEANVHIGAGILTFRGEENQLNGMWRDHVTRTLQFLPPRGTVWQGGNFYGNGGAVVSERSTICHAPANTNVRFTLQFSPVPSAKNHSGEQL